jgi:lipopolysaccharide O-acetyltransferase
MIGKILSFYRENGGYVLGNYLVARLGGQARNRMLAGKLNVRKLDIGPRAHLRGLAFIKLGEDFSAGEGLWLEAISHYGRQRFNPRLVIGNHVHISHWSHIACNHSVTIGDHVLIGSKVIVTDHNHGIFGAGATSPSIPPSERPLDHDRSVIIGSNVWLGDGVVVCPGVTIGEGSVAGANAVITTDVPPFTLVAGVPARPIRRYDEVQQAWVAYRGATGDFNKGSTFQE